MRRGASLVLAVLLAAGSAGAVSAGSVTVKATNGNVFRSEVTRVAKRTKVVWKNTSDRTHNVTATSGNWVKAATIPPGSATGFTFRQVGRYRYRCTIHSTLQNGKCTGMCGRVVVR